MSRALLILPTSSYRGPDFVSAAVDLGIDLVVAADGTLPLATESVEAVLQIDCGAPDVAARQIAELAVLMPLDAVVPVDDQGVIVAAMAGELLGLPHNPPEAAAATRDKTAARRLLEGHGVPQPRFFEMADDGEIEEAIDVVGLPAVVKPPALSGSRGVIRVDTVAEMVDAVARVRLILEAAGEEADGPLLIESYVPGDEVAFEGLVTDGSVEMLALFDKPDPLTGPFFEETIYVTPSRHSDCVVVEISDLVQRAVDAMGLAFGPIHAEVRVDGDRLWVIEVAARSIGGLCGRSLRFGMLDQSLEYFLLRAALGLPRRGMGPSSVATGVMMLPIRTDGILRAVRRTETVFEVPGITDLEITIPLGRRVRPIPEGDRYLGFLFARAEDPAEVESVLREAHGLLDIVIEPIGPDES